jgi:FkbM family methyltransferase
MFYDFVEIGTSDFKTLIQEADDLTRGISIEPIKCYLDRLPSRNRCVKVNAAISSRNGTCQVFYVPPDKIAGYGLPRWTRGCNSIDAPHPTIKRILERKGLEPDKVFSKTVVPRRTLQQCFSDHRVTGAYLLKIDVEGHELDIIKSFFTDDTDNSLMPHRIMFESNELSNAAEVASAIEMLKEKGYELVKSGHDTELRLTITALTSRREFTDEIHGYYLKSYAENYDPKRLPHRNTLWDAQQYCIAHNLGGVTYQRGRFEVRWGAHLIPFRKDPNLCSWIYL